MIVNRLAHDGQAQANSGCSRGKERFEHLTQVLGSNPCASIGDFYFNFREGITPGRPIRRERQTNAPARPSVLQSILNQVSKYAVHLAPVYAQAGNQVEVFQ